MAGIRLYHPTARSGYFTFEHLKRPYGRWNRTLKKFEAIPLFCPACQRVHTVKTYHIKVDDSGHTIVSREIWKMMQRHNTSGFELANEVLKPPRLIVGIGGQPLTPQPLND